MTIFKVIFMVCYTVDGGGRCRARRRQKRMNCSPAPASRVICVDRSEPNGRATVTIFGFASPSFATSFIQPPTAIWNSPSRVRRLQSVVFTDAVELFFFFGILKKLFCPRYFRGTFLSEIVQVLRYHPSHDNRSRT